MSETNPMTSSHGHSASQSLTLQLQHEHDTTCPIQMQAAYVYVLARYIRRLVTIFKKQTLYFGLYFSVLCPHNILKGDM